MEPVPETEGMEEFKGPSVPALRLQESPLHVPSKNPDRAIIIKPPTIRRSTDPTPSSPRSPVFSSPSLAYRPRNTSPYNRGSSQVEVNYKYACTSNVESSVYAWCQRSWPSTIITKTAPFESSWISKSCPYTKEAFG